MARWSMSYFVATPDVTTYGGDRVKRREFITMLGGTVASGVSLSLTLRAQQAMPVIGYLSSRSVGEFSPPCRYSARVWLNLATRKGAT